MPDHSTFSKNLHGRFRGSDLLRKLSEMVVRRCMAEGLVGGDGFAVDAGLIRADANRQRSANGSDVVDCEELAATRRSVREYLETHQRCGLGRGERVFRLRGVLVGISLFKPIAQCLDKTAMLAANAGFAPFQSIFRAAGDQLPLVFQVLKASFPTSVPSRLAQPEPKATDRAADRRRIGEPQ